MMIIVIREEHAGIHHTLLNTEPIVPGGSTKEVSSIGLKPGNGRQPFLSEFAHHIGEIACIVIRMNGALIAHVRGWQRRVSTLIGIEPVGEQSLKIRQMPDMALDRPAIVRI